MTENDIDIDIDCVSMCIYVASLFPVSRSVAPLKPGPRLYHYIGSILQQVQRSHRDNTQWAYEIELFCLLSNAQYTVGTVCGRRTMFAVTV